MSDLASVDTTEQGLKGAVTTVEPDRFARTIARRSAESRATVPAVDYATVVDASGVLTQIAEHAGVTPLLVKAAADALVRHPRANGVYRDARYELYARINIGVTLAEGDTYVTPTVMDANSKSVTEISEELAAYLEVTRHGELHPSALAGATFTIVAPTGHDAVSTGPIILSGQAATLTAGPVRSVPVVRDGNVVPGHTIDLVLAADHRILYGTAATGFLHDIKLELEGAAT